MWWTFLYERSHMKFTTCHKLTGGVVVLVVWHLYALSNHPSFPIGLELQRVSEGAAQSPLQGRHFRLHACTAIFLLTSLTL